MEYAASKGIEPNRLVLLLVDEPRDHADDEQTVVAARAIKAAQPEVRIWTDPVYFDPAEAKPELWCAVDVITPLRPRLNYGGEKAEAFYLAQKDAGKTLELYGCQGPAPRVDPYSYYRLQAWRCFQLGAEASHFWAFGSVGRGGSWNEYLNSTVTYTPLFLGPDSATAAKPMQAIREGQQDYEYLSMLQLRIERIERQVPTHPRLSEAKRLLADACSRVLSQPGVRISEKGVNLSWQGQRDRSVADGVIAEVGRMIEALGE